MHSNGLSSASIKRWALGIAAAVIIGFLFFHQSHPDKVNLAVWDPSGASDLSQDWPHDYEQTTCAQWDNDMSARQRWVAAADILTHYRNVARLDTAPESMVTSYVEDLDDWCGGKDAPRGLMITAVGGWVFAQDTYKQ